MIEEKMHDDLISRTEAIRIASGYCHPANIADELRKLPPAQPEYEPVKVEDFAKTMSGNTLYSFLAWYGEALELMKGYGFVICKKTM